MNPPCGHFRTVSMDSDRKGEVLVLQSEGKSHSHQQGTAVPPPGFCHCKMMSLCVAVSEEAAGEGWIGWKQMIHGGCPEGFSACPRRRSLFES